MMGGTVGLQCSKMEEPLLSLSFFVWKQSQTGVGGFPGSLVTWYLDSL